MIAPALFAALVSASPPDPVDAEEAGRVAFVRFSEAPGVSVVDPVLDGLRAELLAGHGVVLQERRECSAPDLDALACLRDADPSVGAVLQIGAAVGPDAQVVATFDCASEDRFERRVGGPFADDAAAARWGAAVVAPALLSRLAACAALPARVTSENALPAGTIVRLDGRRLTTLEVDAALDVTSLRAGERRFTFEASRHAIAPVDVMTRAHETTRVRVQVERVVLRPRWLFLGLAGASLAAGVGLFVARHQQRSGDCVTTGAGCHVDGARSSRLEDVTDLGAPATMLVSGGTGLAVAELAIPRKEPWWLITLIGAASAGLSGLPWLF